MTPLSQKLWKDQGKFLFVTLLLSTAASAQGSPLRWEEAKSLAERQNPSLRSAGLNWESSQHAVKENYGNFFPEVSLSARKSRGETEAAFLETKARSHTYTVAASWNLFAGFSTWAGLQSAKAAEAESHAQRDLTSVELRYQLRQAYFSVYIQQERIVLFERIVKRLRQNEKLVSLKYDNGTEARWNLRKTQADRERAEYNLEAAKLELASARDQLARYLHLEAFADNVETPAVPAVPPASASGAADESHPQLRLSRATEERFDQAITAARANFLPSLDLSYSRSRDQNEIGSRVRTDSNTVALTASWNIFNGFSDYQKVQQANLRHEAASFDRMSTERQLQNQILVSANNLRSQVMRLPSARSLRAASEERVSTVSAQYRSGLKAYIDWEQAETQLVEAEQQEINALSNALSALADWEKTTGITLEQP